MPHEIWSEVISLALVGLRRIYSSPHGTERAMTHEFVGLQLHAAGVTADAAGAWLALVS